MVREFLKKNSVKTRCTLAHLTSHGTGIGICAVHQFEMWYIMRNRSADYGGGQNTKSSLRLLVGDFMMLRDKGCGCPVGWNQNEPISLVKNPWSWIAELLVGVHERGDWPVVTLSGEGVLAARSSRLWLLLRLAAIFDAKYSCRLMVLVCVRASERNGSLESASLSEFACTK